MFVPVVAVGGVQVSIVQIVGVIPMWDCHMATVWSVLMFVLGVLDTAINGAFVPVIVMLVM